VTAVFDVEAACPEWAGRPAAPELRSVHEQIAHLRDMFARLDGETA